MLYDKFAKGNLIYIIGDYDTSNGINLILQIYLQTSHKFLHFLDFMV